MKIHQNQKQNNKEGSTHRKVAIEAAGIAAIIFTIPLVLALLSARSVVYDLSSYKKEFTKLSVYDDFDYKEFPDIAASRLIDYFQQNNATFPAGLGFSPSEEAHLSDVRRLIKNGELLLSGLLLFDMVVGIVLAVLFKSSRLIVLYVSKLARFASVITIFFIIGGALLFLFFDKTFMLFHEILFPQGNYMFPYNSTIKLIFPDQLFFDMGIMILIRTALYAALMLGIGIIIQYLQNKRLERKVRL